MSHRASATRYARALFDVALAEGSLEPVASELAAVAALFASNAELRGALFNPAVPTSAKKGVIEALLAQSPVQGPLAKLLVMLADRGRLELIPELAAVFEERLMEHQQVVRAEVTTAEPLDAGAVAQLQQRLAQTTGRGVTMTTRVDPAILGGLVARIGGVVYDGSIATQLTRMRQRLVDHA